MTAEASTITDQQEAFVEAYLTTGSVEEASRIAAYSDRNGGDAALRRLSVQRALKSSVERKIKTEGLALAYQTIHRLMKNGNPPATQFATARLVMDMNGLTKADTHDENQKPIASMTEPELVAFLERAQRIVDQGGAAPAISGPSSVAAI